jgi:hypothetical protein
MPRGDRLNPSRNKIRDRCILNPGAVVGGFGREPIKATILQSQDFPGGTRYLMIIDGERPPGKWYAAGAIQEMRQGRTQPVAKAKQAFVIVESPDKSYRARFELDQTGVDSYIAEGYTVTLDDDKNPA